MCPKAGVLRFSLSLPPSLLRDFDKAWEEMGYENRSKAAHDAFRGFVSEYKLTREETGQVIGAIVLLYYVNKPRLMNQIIQAQHKFEKIVLSTIHLHISTEKCLEIIAVKGKSREIRSLSQELQTKKGVKQLKFTAIAE